MNKEGKFVIRVYGLILNQFKEVLISDEYQLNQKMTKFPGGGLEFGEGTIDCLKRELKEECHGQELKNIRHFFTTDFYQKALFYEHHQLISIYYLAEIQEPQRFKISKEPFDFPDFKNGNQSFRWVKIKELDKADITFPIDKFVLGKLKEETE